MAKIIQNDWADFKKRWKQMAEAPLLPERILMDEKNFKDLLDWSKELEQEKLLKEGPTK